MLIVFMEFKVPHTGYHETAFIIILCVGVCVLCTVYCVRGIHAHDINGARAHSPT